MSAEMRECNCGLVMNIHTKARTPKPLTILQKQAKSSVQRCLSAESTLQYQHIYHSRDHRQRLSRTT